MKVNNSSKKEKIVTATTLGATKIEQAIILATMAHTNQTRKSSAAPFVCHPIQVMQILASLGVTDEDMLCAAVLHDVLEDGIRYSEGEEGAGELEVDENEILETFGERTLKIVQEMTFTGKGKQAKAEYLASFSGKSVEAHVMKVIDRIVNTNDFEVAGDDYALKYWLNAAMPDSLLHGFIDRKEEVEKTFGEDFFSVVKEMIYQLTTMHQKKEAKRILKEKLLGTGKVTVEQLESLGF